MTKSTMSVTSDDMKQLFDKMAALKDTLEELHNKINVIITTQSTQSTQSSTRKSTTTGRTALGINIQFMNYVTGKDSKENGRRFFQHMTCGPDEDWLETGKESLWAYDILAPQIELWEKEPDFNAQLAKGAIEVKIKVKAKRIWKEIISPDVAKKKWIRDYLGSLSTDNKSIDVDEPNSAKPKAKSAPKRTAAKPTAKSARKATKTPLDSASDVSSSDEE